MQVPEGETSPDDPRSRASSPPQRVVWVARTLLSPQTGLPLRLQPAHRWRVLLGAPGAIGGKCTVRDDDRRAYRIFQCENRYLDILPLFYRQAGYESLHRDTCERVAKNPMKYAEV
jgi:hypothetical protein